MDVITPRQGGRSRATNSVLGHKLSLNKECCIQVSVKSVLE